MGQQMLQYFYFVPSACLCRLDDTRLEPTDVLIDFSVNLFVGDRTSQRFRCCHLLCLLCR